MSDISYKWDHTICGLLFLTSFTWACFQGSSYLYFSLYSFLRLNNFLLMDIQHFIYPFIYQLMDTWLVSTFSCYEWHCCEHWCISFCVDMFSVLLGVYLGMKLLGHRVTKSLILFLVNVKPRNNYQWENLFLSFLTCLKIDFLFILRNDKVKRIRRVQHCWWQGKGVFLVLFGKRVLE